MAQRALIIAGCLAAGTLVSAYLFWPSTAHEPAAPSSVSVSTSTAAPSQNAVASITPNNPVDPAFTPNPNPITPIYHANTILHDPFPKNPELASTLVSMSLRNAPVYTAISTFAKAGQLTMGTQNILKRTTTTVDHRPLPTIDMELDRAPLLEAVLQLESMGTLNIHIGEGNVLTSNFQMKKQIPGIWSITGPFAFIITAINHSVPIDRQGRGIPMPTTNSDSFTISMNAQAEPAFRIMQSHALVLKEVVDDHGNSLIPTPDPRIGAGFDQGFISIPVFNVNLAYPSNNPGRSIKHFAATSDMLVQAHAEHLAVDDPTQAPASEKDFGSLKVSLSPLTWDKAGTKFVWPITFEKGVMDDEAWANFGKTVSNLRAQLVSDPNQTILIVTQPRVDIVGNKINATFEIRALPRANPQTPSPDMPYVASISLDVPTSIEKITVPVEFHDIPLP